jgi:hypothetical protein
MHRGCCNVHFPATADMNSFSAARLKGFEDDLHLMGQEFNTVLSIFYVGYILMQVPS